MSTVNQIFNIVNDVAKQTFGEKAINVVDTSTLVALGDTVLKSNENTENFTNTLVDRIGKTVFSVRAYKTDNAEGMVREPFEYGCILQKIYVDLPDARENNSWEIGKGNYTPTFAPVIKPTLKQKLFNKQTTWEIDVTIPDFMLRTAFTSATEMAVLIDAIFTSMENTMEIALENNKNLTRANFIASKLHSNKPCGAINLLHLYNTLTNQTLTVDACMRDLGFLKWSTQQINLWAKRLSKMSTLFNDEGYKRFTPQSDLIINVLQDYDSAINSYLQSDTYHNEMTKIASTYSTVPYWQGSGLNYTFADTSKIDVKIDAETTVTESGIIAVIYDRDAMGVTITERRGTTQRNNKDEYTDYFNKATYGYFNDLSENGIVFYVKAV